MPMLAPKDLLLLTLLSVPNLPACGSVSDATDDPVDADANMAWPKRGVVTFSHNLRANPGIRLTNGTFDSESDLDLYQSQILSIGTTGRELVCAKGTYASLSEIPTTTSECPGALSETWSSRAQLSAATIHKTSEAVSAGLGFLVWDRFETTLYRLRIVGDSYDVEGVSTATFDYEPILELGPSAPSARGK
jgi:hypothetical protein